MIWFTSDLHFNHARILEYEPETRPFDTVEQMNDKIIKNWNSVVKPEDTVYVLGDFILGHADTVETILNKLNGTIILVRGNHDTPAKIRAYKSHGVDVRDISYKEYKGVFFIMNHFPPAFSEEFYNMVHSNNSEIVYLYGHVHGNAPKGYYDNAYHVGADTNDLTPISIE